MAVTAAQSDFAGAQPILAAFVSNPRLAEAIEALRTQESIVEGPGGDLKGFFNDKGFDLPENVTVKRSALEGEETLFGVCVKFGHSIYCLDFTIPTAE